MVRAANDVWISGTRLVYTMAEAVQHHVIVDRFFFLSFRQLILVNDQFEDY